MSPIPLNLFSPFLIDVPTIFIHSRSLFMTIIMSHLAVEYLGISNGAYKILEHVKIRFFIFSKFFRQF